MAKERRKKKCALEDVNVPRPNEEKSGSTEGGHPLKMVEPEPHFVHVYSSRG